MFSPSDPSFDPYLVLDVAHTATPGEIRQAYLRLALRHHPDRAGTGGAQRFHEIHKAYALLSDPEARENYDGAHLPGLSYSAWRHHARFAPEDAVEGYAERRRGHEFARPLSFFMEELGGGLVDALLDGLDLLRGGFVPDRVHVDRPQDAADFYLELCLSREEAAHGGDYRFTFPVRRRCPDCQGGSAPWAPPCPRCAGTGQVREERQVQAYVPPGVHDGATTALPLAALGLPGGDISLVVRVA